MEIIMPIAIFELIKDFGLIRYESLSIYKPQSLKKKKHKKNKT